MTTVYFYKKQAGGYQGFTCMGHAEYGKKHLLYREKDVLCAGISALVIHTINALEELAKEELKVVTNEETGFIKCDFLKDLNETSIFTVDALAMSLCNLSKEYGEQYLTVIFEEV